MTNSYRDGYEAGFAAGIVFAEEHQRMHALVAAMHKVDTDTLQRAMDARINALLKEHGAA